ncbi:MAG: hypothetical protein ACPH14_03710 [Candidatus Puniceispirillaceae bacterium]
MHNTAQNGRPQPARPQQADAAGKDGQASKNRKIETGTDDLNLPEACLWGDQLHKRILERQYAHPNQQQQQCNHWPVTLRLLKNRHSHAPSPSTGIMPRPAYSRERRHATKITGTAYSCHDN